MPPARVARAGARRRIHMDYGRRTEAGIGRWSAARSPGPNSIT
jgi:hypothetical protein